MANIDELSIDIKANVNGAIKDLGRLEDAVNKLGLGIDGLERRLSGFSGDINDLAEATGRMSQEGVTVLRNLASALGYLSRSETSGLGDIARNVREFTDTVAGARINASFVSQFGRVARTIAQFSSEAMTEATPNLINTGRAVSTFAERIGMVQFDETLVSQIRSIANSIQRIGGGNSSQNVELTQEALRRLLYTVAQADVSPERLQLVTALAEIARSRQSIERLNNELSRTGINLKGIGKALKIVFTPIGAIGKGLKNLAVSELKGISKEFQGSTKFFSTFQKTYNRIQRGASLVKKFMSSSMDYIETYNYLKQSISQITSKMVGEADADGTMYAEKFMGSIQSVFTKMTGFTEKNGYLIRDTMGKSFGLNPTDTMNYQAQFAQLASSMGVVSDKSIKLSEAITKIGADLASVRNMEFNEVWSSLSSGIVGMSRAVDKFGINIRASAMDEKLLNLGIDATSKSLSQADKAMLRTIIILDSSKYAWGDLANTISQPANQLRILSSNMENLSRTLGNIVLPIVAKLLPYLNAMVIVLEKIAEYIVSLLGFTGFKWGGTSSGGDIASDALDQAEAFDDAGKSAKAYQNQLLGFDEINKLSDNSDNGSGIGIGDASVDLGNALEDTLNRYNEAWELALQRMSNDTNRIANEWLLVFESMKGYAEGGDWESVGKVIGKSLTKGIQKADVFSKALFNPANIEKSVKNFTTTLNSAIENIDFGELGRLTASLGNSLTTMLSTSYNTFDFTNLGSQVGNALSQFVENYNFDELGRAISGRLMSLPKFLSGLLSNTNWSEVINGVQTALSSAVDGISLNEFLDALVESINKIVTSIDAYRLGEMATKLWNSTIGALIDFADDVDWLQVGVKVGEFLAGIDWVTVVNDIFATITTLPLEILSNTLVGLVQGLFDPSIKTEPMQMAFSSLAGSLDKIDQKSDTLRNLADDYTGLLGSGLKDDQTKTKIEELYERIIELEPSLKGILDDETLSWQEKRDAIYEAIDAHDLYEKKIIASKYREKLLQDVADAQYSVLKATQAHAQISEEEDKIFNKGGIQAVTKLGLARYNEIRKIEGSLRDANDELYEAERAVDLFNSAWDDATGTLDVSALKYHQVTTEINGVERTINLTNEGYRLWQEQAEKTNGSVENLQETLDKFNFDKTKADDINGNFVMWGESVNGVQMSINGLEVSDSTKQRLQTDTKNIAKIFDIEGDIKGYASKAGSSFGLTLSQSIKSSLPRNIDLTATTTTTSGRVIGSDKMSVKMVAYANGGFPEDGLFMANHGELVGKFANGRTAVANNEQITEGIRQAVMEGMMAVMSNAGSGATPVIENIFKVDSETLYRMVQKGQQSVEGRYHTVSAF